MHNEITCNVLFSRLSILHSTVLVLHMLLNSDTVQCVQISPTFYFKFVSKATFPLSCMPLQHWIRSTPCWITPMPIRFWLQMAEN